MPLPTDNPAWPPADTARPRALYDTWGAWYSGDPEQLTRVYSGTGPRVRPSQYAGGIVGAAARMWWGRPHPAGQAPARLHIPIASDIAETSADLVFSEPPTLTVEDPAAQARLDQLVTDIGLHATLLEGGELAAAYGGVYLRASWNRAVAGHPLVDAIIPDTAAPEWQAGHLAAVTFWRVVRLDAGTVWRHLERHEPGVIYHGLYQGTADRLGSQRPLADDPTTAVFAAAVGEDGAIPTGLPGLAVVYIPNMRPHRLIRGTPLGRSDYAGVEPLMDAVDEAWSSWMRDLRLAKARLLVPDSYLQSEGRGSSAWFDPEREVYEAMHMLQGPDGAPGITPIQFAIRVEEHARTCAELTSQIVRAAGYSSQTFGEAGEIALTATEARARERRSYSTRQRKIGYATPGLAQLGEIILALDAVQFGSRVPVLRPTVIWPDGVEDAPEATARTITLLDQAGAISTEMKIRMAHPDWDDTQIQAEVAAIRAHEPDPVALAGLISGNATP
ncbi:hypothetical protein GCM10027294_43690 [Marinactinospora endophytica]